LNEVDAIRIEQFRQFKKEIRGSTEYEVVGIDVADLISQIKQILKKSS
jgi:hypothetical protein